MSDEPLDAKDPMTDYWRILVRRRWVIFSFCFICTVTVTIASLLMTPLYRGTATVAVEGEDTNIVSSYESSSTQNVSFDIFENYLQTQVAIILSRAIAGKVFDEFQLSQLPRYRSAKDPLKFFIKKDIHLERLKGSRLIKVSVDNPDPGTAAALANRLAEVYAQDNLMRRSLTFIRNQRMASLNSDFLRLQSKLDSLSNLYGPKHPEMIALKDEIRTMVKRIENEKFAGKGHGDREASPEEQTLSEAALLRVQESSVLASSRMNNIIITDRAVAPMEKYSPKTALNVALSFVGGLVCGVFLAFFINYLDDTLKDEQDVKRHLGGGVLLGTLLFETEKKFSGSRQSNIDHLVTLHPESAAAEAYRLIRTRLLWSIPKENPLKDFAVLSSRPGEGKTTLASNLTIALAQYNYNVLLVDADIRKGRLHTSYGLPNDKGLGKYLSEDIPLDSVVQQTEIPRLSVITCGKSVIDSSQLFDSPKMSDFIRETRKRFDFIIYDTPPVTIISDAAILISKLHGVVLTMRTGLTSAKLLPRVFTIIRESKTKLLGVVLNAADVSDNPSYYHKYYQKR